MKRFGFGVIISLIAAPAPASSWPQNLFAQSPLEIQQEIAANLDLVRETEVFMAPCAGKPNVEYCQFQQVRFIENYVGAIYGDYESISNVVSFLGGDGVPPKSTAPGSLQEGISVVPVQGCAWAQVLMESGAAQVTSSDAEHMKDECVGLSELDLQLASRRARAIRQEIIAHTAKGNSPTAIIANN